MTTGACSTCGHAVDEQFRDSDSLKPVPRHRLRGRPRSCAPRASSSIHRGPAHPENLRDRRDVMLPTRVHVLSRLRPVSTVRWRRVSVAAGHMSVPRADRRVNNVYARDDGYLKDQVGAERTGNIDGLLGPRRRPDLRPGD